MEAGRYGSSPLNTQWGELDAPTVGKVDAVPSQKTVKLASLASRERILEELYKPKMGTGNCEWANLKGLDDS